MDTMRDFIIICAWACACVIIIIMVIRSRVSDVTAI